MRDQTVGSNIREGGDALVNRSSWDRYRLGHRPVDSFQFQSWLNVQSGPHNPAQHQAGECGSL